MAMFFSDPIEVNTQFSYIRGLPDEDSKYMTAIIKLYQGDLFSIPPIPA